MIASDVSTCSVQTPQPHMCRSLTFAIQYACGHKYAKDNQKVGWIVMYCSHAHSIEQVDCKRANCRLSKLHEQGQHACVGTCAQG